MKNDIDTPDRLLAGVAVANVAPDHPEPLAEAVGRKRLHLIEVALMTCREIVEPDHRLAGPEQGFDQVGADEARGAGDEPG